MLDHDHTHGDGGNSTSDGSPLRTASGSRSRSGSDSIVLSAADVQRIAESVVTFLKSPGASPLLTSLSTTPAATSVSGIMQILIFMHSIHDDGAQPKEFNLQVAVAQSEPGGVSQALA